jgi:hypothetical protein
VSSTTDPTAVTGTAVAEIAALASEASKVQLVDVPNAKYADRELFRIDADPKLPTALEFFTLAGLVDYLDAEYGEAEPEDRPLVHVVSPVRVNVVSRLLGEHKHLRRHVAAAVCHSATLEGFQFNQFVPLDTMAIALQTCFEAEVGDVEELRRFCASVRTTASIQLADDGVSQAVEAKSGIAAVQTTGVKNPWQLAPWRTFAEVAQPLSPFVLRFKEGEGKPIAGLFKTGDANWQVEAVKAIADKLREDVGDGWEVLG